MDSLIFDRTLQDVEYVKNLKDKINLKGINSLTEIEKISWNNGLKGSYNSKDFNRVKEWTEYLAEQFNSYGYKVSITSRNALTRTDFPLSSDIQIYLNNIEKLKQAYYTMATTPQLPVNMQNLGYIGANAIEKILYDLNELLKGMVAHFYCLGQVYIGE